MPQPNNPPQPPAAPPCHESKQTLNPLPFLAIAILLLLLAPPPAPAAQTPSSDDVSTLAPRPLVEKLLAQVLVVLRDPQLTKAQRSQKVRDIAYQHIDFETLSRLTMARNWRGLSDTQRQQFIEEFKKHLSVTYAHTTDKYTDEELTVAGDRTEPDGDHTVETRIIGHDPGDSHQVVVKVDYRLRQRNNQWKVIDVTVEGVSLVANFRSQFQEIMANGGFDRLLKLLREKNSQNEQ